MVLSARGGECPARGPAALLHWPSVARQPPLPAPARPFSLRQRSLSTSECRVEGEGEAMCSREAAQWGRGGAAQPPSSPPPLHPRPARERCRASTRPPPPNPSPSAAAVAAPTSRDGAPSTPRLTASSQQQRGQQLLADGLCTQCEGVFACPTFFSSSGSCFHSALAFYSSSEGSGRGAGVVSEQAVASTCTSGRGCDER